MEFTADILWVAFMLIYAIIRNLRKYRQRNGVFKIIMISLLIVFVGVGGYFITLMDAFFGELVLLLLAMYIAEFMAVFIYPIDLLPEARKYRKYMEAVGAYPWLLIIPETATVEQAMEKMEKKLKGRNVSLPEVIMLQKEMVKYLFEAEDWNVTWILTNIQMNFAENMWEYKSIKEFYEDLAEYIDEEMQEESKRARGAGNIEDTTKSLASLILCQVYNKWKLNKMNSEPAKTRR